MNAQKTFHRFTLSLVLGALLAPAAAQAALDSDSASIAAKAQLIRPLTISALNPLDFGTLIKGALTGPVTVVLDPQGSGFPTISSSNPGAVLPTGNVMDGAFLVLGEPGWLVQASYPPSIVIKKGTGGSAATEMTISNFEIDVFQPGGPSVFNDATRQFNMPAGGNARLEVGGRLTVEDNDEYGDYSGTFTVTLSYL